MPERKSIAKPKSPAAQVIEWLVSGNDAHQIERQIHERWPKSKPQDLIDQALGQFARTAAESDAVVVGWAIEAYRDLYRISREAGDIRNAIAALKALTALKLGNVFNSTIEGDESD